MSVSHRNGTRTAPQDVQGAPIIVLLLAGNRCNE